MPRHQVTDWHWSTLVRQNATGVHTLSATIAGANQLGAHRRTLFNFDVGPTGLVSYEATRIDGVDVTGDPTDKFSAATGNCFVHVHHVEQAIGRIPSEFSIEIDLKQKGLWHFRQASIEFVYPHVTLPGQYHLGSIPCLLDLTYLAEDWSRLRTWLNRTMCGANGLPAVFGINPPFNVSGEFKKRLLISFAWGLREHENPLVVLATPRGPGLMRIAIGAVPTLLRLTGLLSKSAMKGG